MQVKDLSGIVQHADGRVELSDSSAIESSPLYNKDLAPVPVARRNWSTYNFAALWTGMSANIPTYMLSSGLIASGMNWWQALITILLGNVIVLAPILLNSHPGTKYGIPFPVLARASYGTTGSNVPALMRAVVACGWFGIQAWIGGQAVFAFFKALFPAIVNSGNALTLIGGHCLAEWLSFLLFWSLNILIIYRGMDLLKKVQGMAAPFVMLMTFALLVWTISRAHGLGYLLADPSKFHSTGQFLKVFFPSLTAMIGFWATLSLNMPDFTRFGHSQREQVVGQVVALPTAMTAFAAMGVMITSAAVVLYPQAPMSELWDPLKLIGRFDQAWIIAISMCTVAVATLSVNIAANVVSPANDFANAFPRWIDFKTGGLITGIVGLAMQPWRLLADPNGYIFTWLLGYSGGLGSIAGVMISDYWLLRGRSLKLLDLYKPAGAYTYSCGWNWRAIVATAAGCTLAWIGLIVPALKFLYDYGWFIGFGTAAIVHFSLMRLMPPNSVPQTLPSQE